jgi:hypothetical protein
MSSDSNIQYAFPYLAYIQDKNYAPTVGFEYYWNCAAYSSNDCASKTSNIIFGKSDYFSG